MRPLGNGGYQNSCNSDCHCDDPLDLEESGSFFMPENLTPEQRLLWAIFGKQPPEEYGEPSQEADCGDSDL